MFSDFLNESFILMLLIIFLSGKLRRLRGFKIKDTPLPLRGGRGAPLILLQSRAGVGHGAQDAPRPFLPDTEFTCSLYYLSPFFLLLATITAPETAAAAASITIIATPAPEPEQPEFSSVVSLPD